MKRTKRTLTRLLDKEVSRVVRMRGSCVKCGKVGNLQAAHIFSRSLRSVRWLRMNILCLCAGCHWDAHKSPLLFAEFVRDHLGEENYISLKAQAKSIKKWTVGEMEELLEALKEVR